ncbi:MAG: ABC transporter permease [Bacteriovorax sp.]|jgi:ABC-type transport system involved in multi-copper enzyme maturation permease subunit
MKTIQKAQWKAMLKDTILKEMRSKTLIFIFIATTLIIFLAHALLKLLVQSSDANTAMMITGANNLSLMFSLINFWSVIVAGIFGISSVRSDFKSNIIYQYLSFPISRTQYMFSRIIGTWILVYSYYLYAYLLSALLFSVATNTMALTVSHLVSMLLMGLYVLLVILISFFYSMFVGKIASFIFLIVTVLTISISTSNMRIVEFADYAKNLNIFRVIGLIVYFFLPRINYVSELAGAVASNEVIKLNVGLETLHLVVTTALFVFIANWVVRKKNF